MAVGEGVAVGERVWVPLAVPVKLIVVLRVGDGVACSLRPRARFPLKRCATEVADQYEGTLEGGCLPD